MQILQHRIAYWLARQNCELPKKRLLPFRHIFLFAALFTSVLSAQVNISEDIRNINLAMFDAKNVSMELTYQIFAGDQLNNEMKGVVKKSGTSVFQQIGNISIIKKEPYCLMVDEEKKIMVVDPYQSDGSAKSREDILMMNIDSVEKLILTTEVKEAGNIREYCFTLKTGRFSRIIFEFNTKNYLLSRIELHSRNDVKDMNGISQNLKMMIFFDEVNIKAKIDESVFSMDKYVLIDTQHKKATPVNAYKNYVFHTSIDKNVKFK